LASTYEHLLRPGRIGSLQLRNRMTVAAMGANLAEPDGSCGERIIAYHQRQAQGGAGLIVLGATGIAFPAGGVQPNQVAISGDAHIPGLRRLAEACHDHGARVAAQIHFGGVVAVQDYAQGRPALVPSYPPAGRSDLAGYMLPEELACLYDPDAPAPQLQVMQQEDIAALVGQFRAAAVRAREAGIDAVEIHAGHGYIISEFLSPAMNQREDEYGGSLQNRARLLLEVIAAVRAGVGRDYPVWVKLDSREFGREEGITLEDAIATARLAESAGVDAIAVSGYHDPNQGALHAESNIPHPVEHLVPNAIAIKHSVSVPVIAAGRIEPASADRHIGRGHFDFFSMGRKLLADPDLPRKLERGEPEQVRPCIYCYCCASQIYIRKPLKCAVNPETGRERERTLVATDAARHIAVVGGGPGGMEVARRLSLRGHRVSLFEAGSRLGGTLQFASIPYEPNQRLLRWLRAQVQASSVEVHLDTVASVELLHGLGVREVVVATGAMRAMPEIPGAGRDFVFSGDEMRALVMGENAPSLRRKTGAFTRLLMDLGARSGASANPSLLRLASKAWLPLGRRITIIGGELVGLELAEFLAARGREVCVLENDERPGRGLFLVRRMRLLDELQHLGVQLHKNVSGVRIEQGAVVYSNYRGQERCLASDHVIVAQGASANPVLAEALHEAGFSVHAIGDCTGVAYIEGAMEQAAELAQAL